MNIKGFVEDLHLSRKILIWIISLLLAAIPTIWLLSSKMTLKNSRLDGMETSIKGIQTDVTGLYTKFDEAEERFTETYEDGVRQVGDIIKESDGRQTDQIQFIVNNWSTENRELIGAALDLKQSQSDKNIDRMVNGVINGLNQEELDTTDSRWNPQIQINEIRPRTGILDGVYWLDNITLEELDSIQLQFTVVMMTLNNNNNYDIQYIKE